MSLKIYHVALIKGAMQERQSMAGRKMPELKEDKGVRGENERDAAEPLTID